MRKKDDKITKRDLYKKSNVGDLDYIRKLWKDQNTMSEVGGPVFMRKNGFFVSSEQSVPGAVRFYLSKNAFSEMIHN